MENYIVSARKYRPATFASVVGQSHITSTLKNAIERGQLAHAYLFCGPRGVGKTTCARIFAKSINCLSPVGCEPCGECESCRSFESGNSMNIHELDAASNNSVEDIRSLTEQVRIIPQIGRYSLFIIDEVHMLSVAAFNAFLKTLEEPPAHAIFILATTERHKILPTILSRCQCYDFNRIRVEDGAEYLRYIADKEGVEVDDESLNLIAQKADGGMRDALSLFDKSVSFGGTKLSYKEVSQSLGVVDYDTYFRLTDELLAGDYGAALITFDGVLGMGFAVGSFVTGLSRHMRDLLVSRDDKTCFLMELTQSLMERYREQGRRATTEFLFGAIGLLAETDGELKRSSSQRLLVELGLMKITSLGQKKNLGEPYNILCGGAVELPELVAQQRETKPQEPQQEAKQEVKETPPPAVVEPIVKLSDIPQPKPAARAPRKAISPLYSLKSAIDKRGGADSATGADSTESVVRQIDPKSAEKIDLVRPQIIARLSDWRPRFIPIFERMELQGNKIVVESPTQELMEEVLRNETQLLGYIKELSAVDGYIELEVRLNEVVEIRKPVKLEDKIAHFTSLNPLVVELTRVFGLTAEA